MLPLGIKIRTNIMDDDFPKQYPRSIALHHNEWVALRSIAIEKGVSRNRLIRDFLQAAILEHSDAIVAA